MADHTPSPTVTVEANRPCAVCGHQFPTVGPGSSWPWTNRTRICEPCLKAVDQ